MVSYGSLNLTVTSPEQTFEGPLTLDEVKGFLGLPERSPADPLEDAELEGYIAAALDTAEFLQGRDLVRKQYDLSLDYFPSCEVRLRDQLVSVDLVRYRDSAGDEHELVADTDYIVDAAKHPGIVMSAYGSSWPVFTPWPSSAVLIRFTCGLSPDSPWWLGPGSRVKQGIQLLISAWHSHKIPFQEGATPVQELPFGITACLSYGSLVSVR